VFLSSSLFPSLSLVLQPSVSSIFHLTKCGRLSSDHSLLDLYQNIRSMHTPSEGLPLGNHPLPAGSAPRGHFQSSPPSRRSPSQPIRSSPLSSSATPGRRRAKSPIPETTPTRLRQHISMTTGASPSILGLQHNRKPQSSTEVLSVPAGAATVAAQAEPILDEPSNLPAITVDPAAPMQMPQAYGEQPPMRLSPQLDPYRPYAEMASYPPGDGVPTHRHFQPHNPYYSHTASPYLPAVGLAPPPRPFMHPPSSSGLYMGPQQLRAGPIKGDFRPLDSDMSNPSDWLTSGYSDTGSKYPESQLQTPPVCGPPQPPKPVEPTSAGIPSLAISMPPIAWVQTCQQ
jgi:hypothetical protein